MHGLGRLSALGALLWALLCANVAFAQVQIQNPGGRAGQSLSGSWMVIVDPAEIGSKSPFEGLPPTPLQNATPWSDDMVLQEWAFDPSVTLKVPGDWNTQDQRLFFYNGDVWYARPIEQPADLKPGERVFVHFGAANYKTTVWLNGAEIGSHEGGYTPFAFEITGKTKPGANMLVVRVDAALSAETLPTTFTDWHNYGGITREVRLIRTPAAFVRDYFVRLTDRAKGVVTATIQLDGAPAGTPVSVSFPDLGEIARGRTDASGAATLTWRTKGGLWSPQTPRLHRLVVEAGGDRVEDRVGLRTIETRGSDILLNGAPIFLRGVSAHEESILHAGRAQGPDDARATLSLIKQLNGNFIRLAHYPHDEATARMADEMGVLVWSELPIYWGMAWTNDGTLASAKRQAEAMVTRDRNRASVILWSLANETPVTEARAKFLGEIARTVRGLDDSRLLTAALYGDPLGYLRKVVPIIAARLAIAPDTPEDQKAKLRAFLAGAGVPESAIAATADVKPQKFIDDPLADLIDVIGVNEYLGWYYEGPLAGIIPASQAQIRKVSLDLLARTEIRTAVAKPLVISEFGADAKAGVRGPVTQIFSEDFQADFYRRQIAMIATIPNLRGVSPWVLKDFRAPRRVLPRLQDGWNRKGLVDENGQRKLAFAVLASAYAPGGAFGEPRP
jgi:beta-glucuronidase